ncbi:NmrA-like family protein [Apiospora kogelbergensis]|uniref:NmrA-like family protein n=1 Tax=Apiospora kogelbergensis TaxID=1337665 RepID=UPI00312EE63D
MAVDYNEVSSKIKILVNNEFHTVISTLTIYDAPTSEAEVNLVRGTAQVVTP